MAERSPAEIRRSIEANRMELAVSLDRLRGEVAHLTDWRAHVQRHRGQLVAGAAVVVRISLIAASWSVSYFHGASGA